MNNNMSQLIHRIRIPINDLISKQLTSLNKSRPAKEFSLDDIRIDRCANHIVLDIREDEIQPKDVQ